MAWIEYTDAEGRQRKVEVPKTETGIVLGRSNACQIVLKSPSVGRNHGKVFFEEGNYVYRDLGSINGSYINERKVQGDTVLKDGDLIRLGDVVVRFVGDAGRQREVATQSAPPKRPAVLTAGTEALSLLELARLRKENEALKAEVASLQKRLSQQDAAKHLEQKVLELEAALSEKNDEIRHLRGVVSDSERRLKDAESRATTLTSSLESVHAKYLEMREEAVHLQRLLEKTRQEMEEKEAEVVSLRDKVALLEQQVEAARNKSGQNLEEVRMLKVKVTEKDREIERLKRELDVREYDLKALKEENERLQEYCTTDTSRQVELERKIRNLEAVIEDNRNLIEELRRRLAERDRELMAARLGVGLANLEQEKQRLLDDFHKKAREVDELRVQVAALTADLKAATQDIEAYQARIRHLEEVARTRKSEREDISDHPDFKAKVREVERLSEEVQGLSKEIEVLRREREAFSPEEQATLRKELAASQEKIRTMQASLDEADAKIRMLKEALARKPQVLVAEAVEKLESVLDGVRVLQAELRDVIHFLERLDASGVATSRLTIGGLGPREAAESLRDVIRMLLKDVQDLRDLLKLETSKGFEA